MVIGAFPIAKLGVLAIKQISKPIANVLKTRAKNSEFFKIYVCMPPAQFYNWCEVKTKMWAMGLGKPQAVPKLNDQMAIELGANLLGEFIIFGIGAVILIAEYVRQSAKESMKEQMVIQEKMELQAMLNELAFQAERQDTQIRELTRIMAELHSKSWTPKIISDAKNTLTDAIGLGLGSRQKKSDKDDDEDDPLQLLPEKRIIRHSLPMPQPRIDPNLTEKHTRYVAGPGTPSVELIFKGDSILFRSLNYLFVDENDQDR